MKRFNIWILVGLICSYGIAGFAFYYGHDIKFFSQYAKLFVIASAVQTVFVLLNLMYTTYLFRVGAVLASFCLVPSNYFTMLGFAKLQDDANKRLGRDNIIESFKLSSKLVIGTTILNAIFFVAVLYFISNPIFKYLILGFISIGFVDAFYRSKVSVINFHKSYLTIKYSPFKASKIVPYSKVEQIRQVNKSIIALIEFVNNKAVSHVIAHASDLESCKIKNISIQAILSKAIKPTHTMADIEQPLASNESQ